MILVGCLLEFIFDIFVEGILELIGYCYIKLMQLIVPNKTISERTKKIIKNAVTTIAAILGVILIVGLILFVQNDPLIKGIGRYMTYIPVAIIFIQITLGIVAKIINHFRKQ